MTEDTITQVKPRAKSSPNHKAHYHLPPTGWAPNLLLKPVLIDRTV